MLFDAENKINKLCAEGMNQEGLGNNQAALKLFEQAWNEASNNLEKLTAAHYVARHQQSVEDKLKWDKKALSFALNVKDKNIQATYPSLYLNIARCYEDLKDLRESEKNYTLALFYAKSLPADGYSNMIQGGIINGLKRLENLKIQL